MPRWPIRTVWQRFMEKVEITPTCWVWTACLNSHGYGKFAIRTSTAYPAHRLAYETLIGKIPKDKQIDHLCRNRKCVNPEHMEAVTVQENLKRGFGPAAINRRKLICKRSHPPSNWHVVRTTGSRECRLCRRLRDNARYHARKSCQR
jgi:hypothetical protein